MFPEIGKELAQSLCSKKKMYYLAQELGVPSPKSFFPRSRQDVLNFLKAATLPIMLKDILHDRLPEYASKTMFLAQSESELLEKYDSVENPEKANLMLQEYIPGSDEAVCFFNGYYNESSDCLFGATGRKLRQWPAYKGVTTLGICLKNEAVEKITNRLMKAIGYRGILDVGYRYDSRDGLYKILDVNPRIGCTFRLFAADNGMDVARALYLDLAGQAMSPAAVIEGRRWLVEDLDLLASVRYLLDRKLTFKQWIASFRGVQESAYFAVDDLLPFLAMSLNVAKKLLKRIYRKLTRRDKRHATSPSSRHNIGMKHTAERPSILKRAAVQPSRLQDRDLYQGMKGHRAENNDRVGNRGFKNEN